MYVCLSIRPSVTLVSYAYTVEYIVHTIQLSDVSNLLRPNFMCLFLGVYPNENVKERSPQSKAKV